MAYQCKELQRARTPGRCIFCPMHAGFPKASKRGTAGCCLGLQALRNSLALCARRLGLHAPSLSQRLSCCTALGGSFGLLSDAASSHMSRPAATACLLTLTYLGKDGGSLTPCATWPSLCQRSSTLHPGRSVLSSGQRWVWRDAAFPTCYAGAVHHAWHA